MKKGSPGFQFAFKGIWHAIATQFNFRIHLLIFMVVISAGLTLNISILEWCVILLASGSVLAAECANTAIEEIVNFISPEHNEKAGKIKDLAAASVLIVSFFAATIGLFIFLPKILLLCFLGHL